MKNKTLILIFSIMSIIGYAQCAPSASNPDSDGDGIADVCDNDDDNDDNDDQQVVQLATHQIDHLPSNNDMAHL